MAAKIIYTAKALLPFQNADYLNYNVLVWQLVTPLWLYTSIAYLINTSTFVNPIPMASILKTI